MKDLEIFDVERYRRNKHGQWVPRAKRDIEAEEAGEQARRKAHDEKISGWQDANDAERERKRRQELKDWGLFNTGWFNQVPTPDTTGMTPGEAALTHQSRNQYVQTRLQESGQARDIERLERKIARERAEQQARAKKMIEEYRERAKKLFAERSAAEVKQNRIQAAFDAKHNKMMNPQRSAYDGYHAQGFGGGEEGGVGATLLTHRGITGGQKLGGKSKLGGKTLLGV